MAIPGIWNPITDPLGLGELAEELRDAYNKIEEWLSNFLANPPRYSDRGILPEVYQLGNTTAEYFVFWVFLLAVMAGVALMKGKLLGRAFLAWIAVGALTPVFVQVVNAMARTGNSWTKAMNFYDMPKQSDPEIDNKILGILLYGVNTGGVLSLGTITVSYEVIIVIVKFLLVIMVALWALSKRVRQIAEILIAAGLVATLLGRPVAQFIIEIGQILRAGFPGSNTLVVSGILIMLTLALANISQVTLMIASYKGVLAIEGAIGALTKGTVTATIKHTIKVDMTRMRKQQPAPQPVYQVAPPSAPNSKSDTARRVGRSVARKGSVALGGAIGVAGYPTVGAGVAAGGKHLFRDK